MSKKTIKKNEVKDERIVEIKIKDASGAEATLDTSADIGLVLTNRGMITISDDYDFQKMVNLLVRVIGLEIVKGQKVDGVIAADLFGLVDEEIANMKKDIAPKVYSRDFAKDFIKGILYQEVVELDAAKPDKDRKYKVLFEKADELVKKAVEKKEKKLLN